jgi:hypothetical protein
MVLPLISDWIRYGAKDPIVSLAELPRSDRVTVESVLRFAGIGKTRKDTRTAKTLGNKELKKSAFRPKRAFL